MEDINIQIPENIREAAAKATENLLPLKSRPTYDKEYGIFRIWKEKNAIDTVNETILMAYFQELVI